MSAGKPPMRWTDYLAMTACYALTALLASDVLTDFNRLARIYRAARDARLKDKAEEDAEAEWKQLGYDAAESQAWDIEDAA